MAIRPQCFSNFEILADQVSLEKEEKKVNELGTYEQTKNIVFSEQRE
jgi:hypothetical protein